MVLNCRGSQQDSLLVMKLLADAEGKLRTGQYQQSLNLASRAQKSAASVHCGTCEAEAIHAVGNAYYYLADYSRAISNFSLGVSRAASLNNKKLLSAGYTDIGLVYFDLGNYATALEYIMEGDRYATELNDLPLKGMTLNSIGLTYEYQGNLELAGQYYLQSLNIRLKLNDSAGLGYCYNNLGSIAFRKGQYAKSLEFHQLALQIRRKIKDYYVVTTSLNNIGRANEKLGHTAEAEKAWKESLSLSKSSGDKYLQSETERMLGYFHLKGMKLPEAYKWASMSLNDALSIHATDLEKEAHKLLWEITESSGDIKLAFYHLKQYQKLHDSLFNASQYARMENIQTGILKSGTRDSLNKINIGRDLAISHNKNRSARNAFIFLGIVFLLVLSLFITGRLNLDVVRQKKRMADIISSLLPLKSGNKIPEKSTHAFCYSGINLSAMNARNPEADENFIDFFTQTMDRQAEKWGLIKVYTLSEEFVFYSPPALSLSDGVQAVTRFAFEVQELFQISVFKEKYHHAFPKIGIQTGSIYEKVLGVRFAESEVWCRPVAEAAILSAQSKPGNIAVSGEVLSLADPAITIKAKGNYSLTDEVYKEYYIIDQNV